MLFCIAEKWHWNLVPPHLSSVSKLLLLRRRLPEQTHRRNPVRRGCHPPGTRPCLPRRILCWSIVQMTLSKERFSNLCSLNYRISTRRSVTASCLLRPRLKSRSTHQVRWKVLIINFELTLRMFSGVVILRANLHLARRNQKSFYNPYQQLLQSTARPDY